jgi:hypothetical protein
MIMTTELPVLPDTTLREAINAAVAQPGAEVISFLPCLTGIIQLMTRCQT